MAFKFIKTGAESAKLAQKAAAEQQQYRESQGKLWRFYLKENEEARITFVDGDLSEEGYLRPPRFYEHNLFLNGSWNNYYICPELSAPELKDKCPICEGADRPSLVALFTIIDHRTQVSAKDKTKVYKDTKRLFVAKPQTFEILNKIAMKRGGLSGITFEVSRVGDKSAAVGSMFDFVEKKPIKELQDTYTIEKIDPKTNAKTKVTNFVPADYDKEIPQRTGDELRKLGLGKTEAGAPSVAPTDQEAADYSKEL